jgi:uncharacterized membrane protein YesL
VSIFDNRFYRMLEVATNFLILNLLWLLCCVPIVTVFPATAALFGVTREWVKEREPGILGSFFGFFRENLRQSLGIGLLWTVFGVILVANVFAIRQMEPEALRIPLFAGTALIGFAYAATSVYLFPVMVNYSAPWRTVLRNSFLFAFGRPGKTLLCLLVVLISAAMVTVLPITLFFVGSVAAYVIYKLCDHAFRGVEEMQRDEDG